MSVFVKRVNCPCCLQKGDVIYETSFNETIMPFLDRYYQSRIQVELFLNEKFVFRECFKCGLVWQQSVLNDEMSFLLYEYWISKEESLKKHSLCQLGKCEAIVRELSFYWRLFKAQPRDIKLMDFGMGWGRWALIAKALNFDVVGFELSESRRVFAENNGIKVLRTLDIPSASLDVLNLDQVLEHVTDPAGLILSLKRLLKVGGVLKISVPDGKRDISYLRSCTWKPEKGATQPLEHINTFTKSSLLKIVENNGFKAMTLLDVLVCFPSLSFLIQFVRKERTTLFFKKL